MIGTDCELQYVEEARIEQLLHRFRLDTMTMPIVHQGAS